MKAHMSPRLVQMAALASLSLALAQRIDAQVVQGGSSLPARVSAATTASIRALADSLRAERLPAFALLDKAAEGALKGADDARILSAVRALAHRLRSSRALLGASGTDDELLAASSALFAGVPDVAIARLVRTQRARDANVPLTTALSIVAELASASVPSELALSSVDELLARGARDADLSAFRGAVDREIRGGVAPREATNNGLQQTLRGIRRIPELP